MFMRTLYIAIAIVCSNFWLVHAQTAGQNNSIKCTYGLTAQIDSTDENSKINELTSLFISKRGSYFASVKELQKDSLKNVVLLTSKRDSPVDLSSIDIPSTFFRFKVVKIEKGSARIYNMVNAQNYSYQVNNSIAWTVHSEQKSIAGFKCQMATGQYGGRYYTAWFTPEIAVSEGPYIFNGLPGLIVKIVDDCNHYKFELLSLEEVDDFTFKLPKNYIDTSQEQFHSVLKQFKMHPIQELSKIATVDWSAEDIKRIREKYEKRNNTIELLNQ